MEPGPHLRLISGSNAVDQRTKCTAGLMAGTRCSGQPRSMLATKGTPAPIGRRAFEADAGSAERRLAEAVGYRVEGDSAAGVVVGVPVAGCPPRPLVLVVRDGDCVRFISLRRVRAISSDERRVVLLPEGERWMKWALVAPPLVLVLIAAVACASLALGNSARRRGSKRSPLATASARDGAVARWPEWSPAGRLVTADLG